MRSAPEWYVSRWFNSTAPLSLASLRGRVIVLYAFQMRCPGCLERALPQAERVHTLFQGTDVQVVGLHTVFEDHASMPPETLESFLREQGLTFPVGVDEPGLEGDPVPRTMREYDLQGTPTLVLIDRRGHLRRQLLGHREDLLLGAEIGTLLAEEVEALTVQGAEEPSDRCEAEGRAS